MYNNADLQRHIGKFYGKYSGEVVNNEDAENRGQITVLVPTIFGIESENTVIARPCLPYGHFYIPAIGTKVWVEFEAGDLAYPIWVGTWYPIDSTPEEAAVTPPDRRVIHTASGHIIELSDQEGEEKITIRHKNNSFLSIDSEGSVILGNHKGSTVILNAKDENMVLIEQHGNTVSMTKDGIVVVNNQGGAAVELKGDMARIVAKDILLQGSSVALGAANSPTELEPTIKGNAFKLLWDVFIFHTHATAMGPSGPPVPPAQPLTPQVLSSAVAVK